MADKKGKTSKFQEAFRVGGFDGEKIAIKKRKPQWQLDEERHARRAHFEKLNRPKKK